MKIGYSCVIGSVLLGALLASPLISPPVVGAQGNSGGKKATDKGKDSKKDEKDSGKTEAEAQPNLMGGKSLRLKSSRQEKDSATMGFNGLDPQGKVEKSMLASAATVVDLVNAKSLVAFAPVQKELDAFVQDGNLKTAAPKPADQKKK
jgi:hypothetical protein